MRLLYPSFASLEATKQDAVHARQIAHGFGIPDSNIDEVTNTSAVELNKVFSNVKREFQAL